MASPGALGLLEVRYPENILRQPLKTYVTLAAVAMLVVVLVVVSSWIGLLIWGRLAGPTVDETAIVTVVANPVTFCFIAKGR